MTLASPSAISRPASPIACAPVEQAVTTAWLGPLRLWAIETCPLNRLMSLSGNEERRDAARSLFVQSDGGVVNAAKPPDSRAEQDPGLGLLLVGLGAPARVAQSLGRGAHAVNDEVVDAALFLGIHPVVGIESVRSAAARHLRGDFGKAGRKRRSSRPGPPPTRWPEAAARSPRPRKRSGTPCQDL